MDAPVFNHDLFHSSFCRYLKPQAGRTRRRVIKSEYSPSLSFPATTGPISSTSRRNDYGNASCINKHYVRFSSGLALIIFIIKHTLQRWNDIFVTQRSCLPSGYSPQPPHPTLTHRPSLLSARPCFSPHIQPPHSDVHLHIYCLKLFFPPRISDIPSSVQYGQGSPTCLAN